MAQKDKVKELVGRGLHSYHTKALQQIDRIEKKNKEQNHKINILTNELDNDYLTKTEEGSVVSLEHSKEGMVYLDGLQGNTLVNYCVDGAKELTLNGDIDVEGTNVTLTDTVDNGLVDVSLEGNTLVNLSNHFIDKEKTFTLNSGDWYNQVTICDTSMIKLNVDYTLIYDIEVIENNTTWVLDTNTKMVIGQSDIKDSLQSHPTIVNSISNNGKGTTIWDTPCYSNNKILFNINTWNTLNSKYFSIRPIYYTQLKEGESIKYKIKNLILLEGNWTSKEIPKHFNGMKSVAECEDNKIEILSRNKNFVEVSQSKIRYKWQSQCTILSNGGIEVRPTTTTGVSYTRIGSYKLKKGSRYIFNHNGSGNVRNVLVWTGENGTGDYTEVDITKPLERDMLVDIAFYVTNDSLDNVATFYPQIEMGDISTNQVSHTLNKKEISLNEPLRALPNGFKDKVVKIGNKWYVQRNCIEILLDGITNSGCTRTGTIEYNADRTRVKYPFGINSVKSTSKVICDKLMQVNDASGLPNDVDGISTGSGSWKIMLNLPVSLVGTTDESMNAYLQLNNLTIIAELDTPIYEELEVASTLNTYADVTHISNNSTIPCDMKIQNSGYNAIIKPSTQYTVAFDTDKSGEVGINLAGSKVTTTNNIATITTPSTLVDDSLRLYGKGIKASRVRLLEGDKTNWIPSYFEGMKSSFEDKLQDDGTYKMEILSNNKNLFDGSNIIKNSCLSNNGSYYTLENSLTIFKLIPVYNIDYIKVSSKYVSNSNMVYSLFDSKGKFLKRDYGVLTSSYQVPTGVYYIKFTIQNYGDMSKVDTDDIQVEYGTVATNFEPNKNNKIQFSSIEPLRGVGDVKDRFVFKDGKLMIERNCGTGILNGNENWDKHILTDDDLRKNVFVGVCWIEAPVNNASSGSLVANNVIPRNDTINPRSFYIISESFILVIDNKELSTRSVEGLKEWLRNNPITYVYKREEPTYEEIPFELQKIILEGYENGTLFFDTNIPPTVTTTYAGETPIVKSVKLNKTEVLKNTDDINDNIVPYLMDMDYRVVCLQLEGGIENISMARLFGGTYEMLQRDILSKRYSKEEYKYRLDAYLSANKITEDEYNKLGDMLNE